MNRVLQKYKEEVIPALTKKFGYTTVMQVPKIDKIVDFPQPEGPIIDTISFFFKVKLISSIA